MRSLPPGFQEHLDGGATTLSWCWKLVDASGRVFGFTDHDCDLDIAGLRYEASSGFTASEMQSALGLGVDNLEIAGALRSDRLSDSDLAAGRFDDATLEIWLVNWSDLDHRILMRTGTIGEITRNEAGFIAEVRGLAHALSRPQGRLYQYGCDAELGDARCRVDVAAPVFRAEGTVAAVLSVSRFAADGLAAFADGWFARGRLTWTGGANAGSGVDVRSHRLADGRVTLDTWQPAAAPIAAGDGFDLIAGCDKQFATCRDKFSNAVNFRGFPHMPGNDFVLSYATGGDAR
jgi:uncharacterized phage protein (TIGR02218 family)